jgi:hypothetical protein
MFQVMAGPDDRDPLSLPDTGEEFCAAVQGAPRLTGLRVAWTPDLGCYLEADSPDFSGAQNSLPSSMPISAWQQ